MYYEIGRQGLSEAILETAEHLQVEYQFPWMINWYYKDGGRKDTFYLGMENSPIAKIDFELNKHLLGAGTCEFASIPIPVDAGDYLDIYYKNNIIYRGYVNNYVDLKGGKLKLKPKSERLSKLIINKSYTTQTIASMLQDIIEEVQSDSGITWLDALVNTGESTTYSFDFNYESAKKAIDDLVSKLDDREHGVTVGDIFTVYTPDTSSNIILTQSSTPMYSKASRKINYDNVKNTRYQVFKKDNAGDVVRVGEVGYGGSYPILDIETTIGEKREEKYVSSIEGISDADVLAMAYADLQAKSILPEVINIDSVDLDAYYQEYGKTPDISEYLKVLDDREKVLSTIINCDSATNWTNATLETDDFVEGSGSIKLSGYDPTSSAGYYDFSEIYRYHKPEYMLIMLKSVETGSVLEFGYSNTIGTLWDDVQVIYINESNKWQTFRYDFSDSITMRYLGFRYSDTISMDTRYYNNMGIIGMSEGFVDTPANKFVYIDRIQLCLYARNEYTGDIVQQKYIINKNGHDLKLTLADYDTGANDELNKLQKKLAITESIQQQ